MKSLSKVPVGSAVAMCTALLIGCASKPSEQLITAQNAYDVAARGPASRYAPDELLQARNLLEKAEAADDGSGQEQQLAYLADRQTRIATAEASIRENEKRLSEANQKYVTLQEQGRVAAERGLSETQQQLTESQRMQREAEARAMASLEELGKLKKEANETTLTLSGEVLFKTGQAELLPLAEQRLDAVAKALKELPPSQTVVIEGHTDSVGADDMNKRLSQERADSVRTYLISQGVNGDKLTAVGRGESEPIADNDTAEGRANNRRVELVIKKSETAAPTP